MQLRIHLPQSDKRPVEDGFRWCTKDSRWEKNCRKEPVNLEQLRNKWGTSFETFQKQRG